MLTWFQSKQITKISTLVTVFAALLLAGCINAQSNVALYGNGQWSGVQAMTLSAEFVEMMESSGEGTGDISTETEGLDEWLQQAQSASDRADLNVSFNEVKNDDGSLSYILQASGQGLETLNEVMFQGEADIQEAVIDGQKRITIVYDASQSGDNSGSAPTPEEAQMSAEMMQAFGISIITKISGGDIISHNADRVEGGTAVWETPTVVEITLTEAAQLNPETLTLDDNPATGAFDLTALINAANQMDPNATAPTADDSTAQTQATTDDSAVPATEQTEPTTPGDAADASPQEAPADAATQTSDDAPAAAPADASDALPQSGAILPGNVSDAPLVFGGLVLIALITAGATAGVWRKR